MHIEASIAFFTNTVYRMTTLSHPPCTILYIYIYTYTCSYSCMYEHSVKWYGSILCRSSLSFSFDLFSEGHRNSISSLCFSHIKLENAVFYNVISVYIETIFRNSLRCFVSLWHITPIAIYTYMYTCVCAFSTMFTWLMSYCFFCAFFCSLFFMQKKRNLSML